MNHEKHKRHEKIASNSFSFVSFVYFVVSLCVSPSPWFIYDMNIRAVLSGCMLLAIAVSTAAAYIHFPPMTMEKMCQHSHAIRVLRVKKLDKKRGIVLFELVETLKEGKLSGKSFKQVIPPDTKGSKQILDWLDSDKHVVMFTIEGGNIACGYVCIDELWYSVDQNKRDDYWLLLRVDPQMSACFHGSVEELEQVTKDVLAGKDVKIPVKELPAPLTQDDRDRRAREVNEVLEKNRK